MAYRQVRKLLIARLSISTTESRVKSFFLRIIPITRWKANDEKQEQEDRNQILICSIKGRFIGLSGISGMEWWNGIVEWNME